MHTTQIEPTRPRTSPGHVLLILAALVVVIAGLRAAEAILVPILLAACLAVICFPILSYLQQWGLPGWLALLTVLGITILAVLAVVAVAGASFEDFRAHLPEYQERLVDQQRRLVAWLEARGVDAAERRGFDARRLVSLTATVVGSLAALFSNAALILLLLAFMLAEAAQLPAKLASMSESGPQTARRARQILVDVRRYMALKTGMCLLTAALVAAWLALLGVSYPLLWGLLAFFFNFIPNIGSLIAAVPPVLLALVQHGPGTAAAAAAGCLTINGIIGSLVEPRVMGRGLGLSTLVVFLSLLFWGWVLGPAGMLLSVPLTMILKILLESGEQTRWIAVLLGPGAVAPDKDKAAHAQELPDFFSSEGR
jgi:AI-2 transport protein TqsA